MIDILLIIMIIVFIIEVIIELILKIKTRQLTNEILENYRKLIDVELELEDIVLKAEVSNEKPVETISKIKKVLFPNAN